MRTISHAAFFLEGRISRLRHRVIHNLMAALIAALLFRTCSPSAAPMPFSTILNYRIHMIYPDGTTVADSTAEVAPPPQP